MSTTTIAFFLDRMRIVCPECHEALDADDMPAERLCRRDVEPGTECDECGATIVADPDDAVRERPNAWDEGGKEEWKEMRS